jgi:hypothetical protein
MVGGQVMSIRVRKSDNGEVTFEAESEGDLRLIVDVLGIGSGKPTKTPSAQGASAPESSREAPESHRGRASGADVFAQKVVTFLGRIHGSQQTIIKGLASAPDGLTDAQLREMLGVQDNHPVGGAMTGIAKNARSSGLDTTEILVKTTTERGDGRSYHYRLTPRFLTVLEEVRPDLEDG